MSRKRLKSLKLFTPGLTCTSCASDSRAFISTRMYLSRGYAFFCTKILSLFQEKILEIVIYD